MALYERIIVGTNLTGISCSGNYHGEFSGDLVDPVNNRSPGSVYVGYDVETLEEARTSASYVGKTVVVTTALTEAQSNILAAWPADRALKVEKGSVINNSAAFTISGSFEAGLYQVFAGTGSVAFSPGSVKELPAEWWGAVQDADNAVAINAALTSATASKIGTVTIRGTNFISATVSIPMGVTLKGTGSRSAYQLGVEGSPTNITKLAALSGLAVLLDGKRSSLKGVGVFSQTGALGSGIQIAANYATLEDVASIGHQGSGILVGGTWEYRNTNGFTLNRVTASYNGQYGIQLSDAFQLSASPSVVPGDANAGVLSSIEVSHNTQDGLRVNNSMRNTISGVLAQVNGGYGVYFDTASIDNTFVGGDQDEGNATGSIYNAGTRNTFLSTTGVVDAGTYTQVIGYTSSVFNSTTVKQKLEVATLATSGAPTVFSISNQANNATGAGVAFEMKVPNGGSASASRIATKFSSTQTALAGYDALTIAINQNNSVDPYLILDGRAGYGMYPGTDNTKPLGVASNRWSTIYASTGTINTSDAREKQDITPITDEALAAWADVNFVQFQWISNPDKKQFGVIAQQVVEAFAKHGLNALDYGLVDYSIDADRYGVRYDQAMVLEAALMRRKFIELQKHTAVQ